MKKDAIGARTYRLSGDTIKRLNLLTARLETWQSDLVDLLLQRSLDEIESGNWQLDQRPVKFELDWAQSATASE